MKTKNVALVILCVIAIGVAGYFLIQHDEHPPAASIAITPVGNKTDELWNAPDSASLDVDTDSGKLIAYGRELISHTARYLGPKGTVLQISNGLNCQNCHLQAGTKPWGNNYAGVYATYPKMRARSGTVEDIYKRINDCMQRSLNGESLDTLSREMQAIYAYFKWLGRGLPRDVKPAGAGIKQLAFLDRAADPVRGKIVYDQNCRVCHGADGSGQLMADGRSYLYPPLWGEHSYSTAAGLFRLSRFAGYAYNNMPFGVTYESPVLTEEEAWDVAAFVNSQERPVRTFKEDWPDITKKPFDHPFGPYADDYTEEQHKFGPYGPITQSTLQ